MYAKDTIHFTILEDLKDESGMEVLRAKMRPTRLPRGVSSIITGLVYHPPKAVNSAMLDYLKICLVNIESRYPTCGIIVLDVLNKLNDSRLKALVYTNCTPLLFHRFRVYFLYTPTK